MADRRPVGCLCGGDDLDGQVDLGRGRREGVMISMARSTSAVVGAKASTMGRICAGWMLHMRV